MVAPQADADTGSTCTATGPAVLVVTLLADGDPPSTTRFSTAQLCELTDVPSGTMQVRASPKSDPQPLDFTNGVSMDAVLTAAGVVPGTVHYTEVSGQETTGESLLSQDTKDFAQPGDEGFPFQVDHPSVPPVFFSADGGDTLEYVRPMRTYSDLNAADVRTGAVLGLDVHLTGHLLRPQLAASRGSAKVGQDVSFTSRAADVDRGEQLTYDIDFGDGNDAQSAPTASTQQYRAVHSFTEAGFYYVYVTVEGSLGSSGVSKAVVVHVTEPLPPKKPTTTPKPATSGPSHGNGGGNAPIGGPVNGSGTHVRGPVTGSSTRPTPLRSASPTRTVPSRTVVPTASRSRTGPTISSTATDTSTQLPAAGASSAAAGPRRGVAVVGFAAAAALPAGGLDGGSASTPPAPAARSSIDHHANPVAVLAIVIALATLGLLWLGAVAESRRPSRKASRAR